MTKWAQQIQLNLQPDDSSSGREARSRFETREFLSALIFVCLICAPVLVAQTPVSATQAEARGASAVGVVTQIASAAGCAASATDVLATGMLTANGASERLVIKARPQHQFRSERPDSAIVLVVNGNFGKITTSQGTTQLQSHEAAGVVPWMFPCFTNIAKVSQPDMSVSQLPVDDSGGTRIRLQAGAGATPIDAVTARVTAVSITVPSGSQLPSELEVFRPSREGSSAGIAVTFRLSDYRRVGAQMFPFHIEEVVSGRTTNVVQFETIQLDAGLSDTDFALN